MDEIKEEKPKRGFKKLVAKKDFIIVQNKERYEIKKGDDVNKIPNKFHENLKTENVI